MHQIKKVHPIITILIASVWLINGLFCKVLHLVPRHQAIVARILGDKYAHPLTIGIGILEICMAVWVMTGYKSTFNAVLQISIVAAMNILEFMLAPDLLLWGRLNSCFALLFIGIVYYNEFVLRGKSKLQQL